MSPVKDKGKNINLQMIRGVCCLFICLNHCSFFNKYSFGEVGVEFFIILSGFLTTMNASKSDHLRTNYLVSKVRRITPLYWVTTLAVFILGIALPSLFSSLDFSFNSLFYSLFLVPGHTFILFPGWTLTYFFIFYLVYWIADKISLKRDLTASIIIVVFVIAGFIVRSIFDNNLFSNYANPVLLEFVYGIGLYYFVSKIEIKNKFTILGGFIMIALFFNYNKFLGPRWLVPSLLTCLAIFFLYYRNEKSTVKQLLANIGNISFTIYILHPIIIRPIDKLLIKVTGSDTSVLYFGGIIIGLAFVISICSVVQKFLQRIRMI